MTTQPHFSNYMLQFPTTDGGQLNLLDPFRGTLIVGATGSGKTSSLARPISEQLARKNFAGLLYSADGALSTKGLAEAMASTTASPPTTELAVRRRVLDFYDLQCSEKVNPLHPRLIVSVGDAMEVAANLLASLSAGGAKSGDNFFTKSAEAYLTGIIWFYRNNYPALCTIPHVVATALYPDFTHVLHMLSQDASCQVLVQSFITAVQQGAEKQIAGIVASLQVDMSGLATPEISWVLSPDETNGEGFSLDLNNPNNPTLLTISNDPTAPGHYRTAYSAVISCVIGQALKQMNRANQHHSYVLLDDVETIHVRGGEILPATARSNKIALVYITQDMAQLIDAYGKDKALVLVSNLNNQFFGRINSVESGKMLSHLVNRGDFTSTQASDLVKTGFTLGPGELIGQLMAVPEGPIFQCALLPTTTEPFLVPDKPAEVSEELAQAMAGKVVSVRQQVAETIGNYLNPLSGESSNGK